MDYSQKLAFSHASFLLFLTLFFYLNTVSCTTNPQFKYSVHCNSIVHEAKPGDEEFHVSPFSERQYGYYSGGDDILNRSSDPYYSPESKVVVFETHRVYTTDFEDVFKVEGSLIFQTSYLYEQSFSSAFSSTVYYSSDDSSKRGALDLDFEGFWSRKTGEICMVGSSYTSSKQGKSLPVAAVLKLNNLKDSSNITTLVTGTLDSLNGDDQENHFEQISLLMFPQVGYKYTKVSKQFTQGCPGGTDFPDKSSLGLLRSRTICDMLSGRGHAFRIQYASGCDSSNTCHPFGDAIGYLPKFMSLSMIQCSEDKQSLRFHIGFQNVSYMSYYRSSNFSTSLVGEGSWDAKKNRLCIVACRIILDASSSSLDKAHVGDCTTRLSLRFPAVLSIKNPNYITGEIWSDKPRNEAGFFGKILFQKAEHNTGGIQLQGLKYEYTESDKVKKSCLMKKPTRNNRGEYPDGYSKDMSFHISGTNERIGWGSAYPLAVGDKLNQRFPFLVASSSSRNESSSTNSSSLLNISYIIKLEGASSNESKEIQISAEGVYDAETGNLCMIGCKHLIDSMDCEILVKFQFSPSNSDKGRGNNIKGSIESMRQSTDSLRFEPLQISARANYVSWSSESIPRMNFEMIMSVISNTLAIVFVAFQIFHVRKHRGVGPSVSLVMLVVLALGHLTPLVLNLEAMFTQEDSRRSILWRSGIWVEMKEVIIRVVTMVAFLLETRLLILSWNARSSSEKQKQLWSAEKRGLCVCVPIYLVGAAIAFLVKWRQNMVGKGNLVDIRFRRHYSSYNRDVENIILGGSRAYAGLMLDAFLFPQIIFNMFHNSKQEALSRSFYIGTTLIRLLPHGYDLYRAHSYVGIDDSYIYADPKSDYYSTAWDIIIPLLALLLARTIHLQQKFGGRFFLPNRYQESGKYQQLPMASED
ncbi:hypothetical protein COLO4_24815 [Corchorus olitorius]|uniref:RING-type E3 ubiquitin transferase n=1 Tax=Corchorus olitorius TaxID=93759 RepID=A0A1R3I6G3_9ROSI|nr:hypothetical protein COLO4_24815 [Corchorus olitorius]